jgi:hypothetical protein
MTRKRAALVVLYEVFRVRKVYGQRKAAIKVEIVKE